MSNWTDRLISEYSKEKGQLNRLRNNLDSNDPVDREDLKKVNSMVADMDFVIEWLETGKQPGVSRGIDKRDAYRTIFYEDMDMLPDIKEELEVESKRLYMSNSERQALLQLFETFSHREKQCYILHFAQGLSMGEIADELGISKATVQSYISRARKKVEEIAS